MVSLVHDALVKFIGVNMRVIRIKEVCQKVGLSRPSVLRKSREGTFPARINVGARAIGFIEEEVEEWLQEQAKKRKPTKAISSKRAKS